jgi:hypothetical protein
MTTGLDLKLLVPGLLGPWPAAQIQHISEDFEAPSVALAIRRAGVVPAPVDGGGVAGAVLSAFGLASVPAGAGAAVASYLSDTWDGDSGTSAGDTTQPRVRIDPVHLRAEPQGAIVIRGEALALARDDAVALAAELAGIRGRPAPEVFDATRWYLPLGDELETTPPSAVVGPATRTALPGGPDGAVWRAWLTEAQMILHASPVNERREAAGLPPVNSVWVWGSGAMNLPDTPRFDRVLSSDPVARGIGLAYQLRGREVSVADIPASMVSLLSTVKSWGAGERKALVVLPQLHGLATSGNVESWRRGVTWIDEDWLAPAIDAIRSGTLERVVLDMPPHGTLTLDPRALRRFWRWRQPFATLLGSVQ